MAGAHDPSARRPNRVFFGYPSRPPVRKDTIVRAASNIGLNGRVETVTWEDLNVTGRLIVAEIAQAIESSRLSVFEVTDLNQNVLFELGYATGRRATVWLLRDPSDARAERDWKRFSLLSTIGYQPYTNSDQIVAAFEQQRPDERGESVYDDLIALTLTVGEPSALFYMKSLYDTDPSRAITRVLESHAGNSFRIATADPTESPVQPLAWYAQTLFNSRIALIHFTGGNRAEAEIHNARCALVAGLAYGMGKPILMLAESDYSAPIDYQDLLVVYQSATQAADASADWVRRVLPASRSGIQADLPVAGTDLAKKLGGLRLGNHVAENESETLGDYFVKTASYRTVLTSVTTIFTGRKGSGKTANLLQAADEIGRNRLNLVCVIRPPAYELESVLRLLRRYKQHDEKGYLVESLWKFLLFSEIAQSTVEEIRARAVPPALGTPEAVLLDLMSTSPFDGSFAVRLERAVDDLLSVDLSEKVEVGRLRISEALHDGVLRDLRQTLGEVLSRRQRVAVLIDNLDKAWERSAEIGELSFFLLGLLGSLRSIRHELTRSDHWRSSLNLTLAVFLRTDIFTEVQRVAREPDKLPVSEMKWTDRELLMRVLEDRYAAIADEDGSMLWSFFSATVGGQNARARIEDRTLPRPRDVIFYSNAAVTNAINRQHAIVESKDLLDAEYEYSQFALESVVVEGTATIPEIDQVLYEFAGYREIVGESEVAQLIGRIVSGSRMRAVLEFLQSASFLGVETRSGQFAYPEFGTDDGVVQALARRLEAQRNSERRYRIHPAFWSYLEIQDG